MALHLNPLSTAKGKSFDCEMCGKPAALACQHCRVTYYCGKEHQSTDWFGIHEKICQLLGALRTLRPSLGSEEERQRRNLTVQMSQHALIDLCKHEAHKHLVAGNYDLAIPGALQSLRFSMAVHGSGSVELVPAYLLLAEANLGLKRYSTAEEFLVYGNWSVLKNPDCGNELKSKLFRNFGKLYASQGRYDEALKQLAFDVYYSSLESGPEHFDTCNGYYEMASVFMAKEDVEHALAFMDKVVDIWYKFLVKLRHQGTEDISQYLGEAQLREAADTLSAIISTRGDHLGQQHMATGEAYYTLGLLKHCTQEYMEAKSLYSKALDIYLVHLGDDHKSTQSLQALLDTLEEEQRLAEQEAKEEKSADTPAVDEKSLISASLKQLKEQTSQAPAGADTPLGSVLQASASAADQHGGQAGGVPE